MKRIPLINLRFIQWLVFIAVIGGPITINAQPGWEDLTTCYFYTLLDKDGEEIIFENNKKYSIIVDKKHYNPSAIPNDILRKALPSDKGFQIQIRINDCSLSIPQKTYKPDNTLLEIKIIHRKDTMHICQPTGIGSVNTDQTGTPSDITLQFIAGHYYFPEWAKYLFDNYPNFSGSVKLINVSQRHFIVPKHIYTAIVNKNYIRLEEANNYVVNNFMKGYFSVDQRIETTQFKNETLPYTHPSWNSPIYPSVDPDTYYGMLTYTMRTSGCSSYKSFFSILNKKDNTINHWFPLKNTRLFSSDKLYLDTFNTTIYLPVLIKKEFDYNLTDCEDDTPFEKIIYRSNDEGKTWRDDTTVQRLFNKYNFGELEFLDSEHAFAYRRKRTSTNENTEKDIGVYYLLKNMAVIDSFNTPNNIHYNTNYNNYRFSLENDTVYVGTWTHEKHYTHDKPYYRLYLTKTRNHWTFQVKKTNYISSAIQPQEEPNTLKKYHNFNLIHKRELVFNNGSGTLILKEDVVKNTYDKGYYVLEKGKQIYLVSNTQDRSTYFSLNGGKTWYVYPLPLEGRNYNYQLLDINEQDELSHFSNIWIDDGKQIRKVINAFILEK